MTGASLAIFWIAAFKNASVFPGDASFFRPQPFTVP